MANDDALVRARVGRKRDDTLDAQLLAAAIDVLAETGYDRMTVGMVAARVGAGKASVYRRWPSKAELVSEAIRASARDHVDLDGLPDTGTLRGDMVALFKPHTVEEGERIIKAMAGVAAVLSQDIFKADVSRTLEADPWAVAHERLIARAVARGEIAAPHDIAAMARVVPSLVTYRAVIQRQIVDLPFLTAAIEDVLLPALGIGLRPGKYVLGRG